MENLGSRLKNLRLKKNRSINEIAHKVGVSVSTYRDWEHGRKITGEPYAKLADALDTSLYFLLTGDMPVIESALIGIENHIKVIRRNL